MFIDDESNVHNLRRSTEIENEPYLPRKSPQNLRRNTHESPLKPAVFAAETSSTEHRNDSEFKSGAKRFDTEEASSLIKGFDFNQNLGSF